MARWLSVFVLLLALLAPTSAFAQQQTRWNQCAVGYTGAGDVDGLFVPVIRLYYGTNTRENINIDASVCTNLIARGDWVGVSKDAEWIAGRTAIGSFYKVCSVTFPIDPAISVEVYAHYSSRSSENGAIYLLAGADCAGFDPAFANVTWADDANSSTARTQDYGWD